VTSTVVVVTTGGTIASRRDAVLGLVPDRAWRDPHPQEIGT
jgi:L-asparaginase/Glu-tRNA(Gln) amidotransferase subunit D